MLNHNKVKENFMKIVKINHLGIAVNSIEQGKGIWTDALGLAF